MEEERILEKLVLAEGWENRMAQWRLWEAERWKMQVRAE